MVYDGDIGAMIEYRGNVFGRFPRGMTHVLFKLISLCGDAAFLESSNGEIIYGVAAEDCYPETPPIDQWTISAVQRTRPGSWT